MSELSWLHTYYRLFRKAGYSAHDALRNARIYDQFTDLENDERVRISAEIEDENYFHVYGEPDGYTQSDGRRISASQARIEIEKLIARNGLWCVIAYYKQQPCEKCQAVEAWQIADSVGMVIEVDPTNPFTNCYVIDLMQAAINAAS